MAYAPHHHPVEDVLNISKGTKRILVDGDINYATLIDRGVFDTEVVPFGSILTNGTEILVDHNGDVLWAYTPAVGRLVTTLAIVPAPPTEPAEPNRLLIQSDKAWIQDIDTELYYRLFVEEVDGVPSIVLSPDGYVVEPGGSPYSGDLLIYNGLAYLRNEASGLYKEWHIETVFGTPLFVLSDEDYDLSVGNGSPLSGNLVWTGGKAYLMNDTSGNYHEIYAQVVEGVPSFLISTTDYASL